VAHRKVLHVYKDFEPRRGGGGVARHIGGLAASTASENLSVRVVAFAADETAGDGAYEVAQVGWRELAKHVAWADIVHVHGARTLTSPVSAAIAKLLRKRLVYTPHCYYDHGPLLKRCAKAVWDALVERGLLRSSDAVVLLSDFWLQYLTKRGLRPRQPQIVPNCVLNSEIKRVGRGQITKLDGKPSILSVGRLDQVKRIDDVVGALALPGLSEAVFHVVGRGPELGKLTALAERIGVSDRLRTYGFVGDQTVAEMAGAADMFVLPSAEEGMPTVIIEMLLRGLPVVASDIPGNRSVLEKAGTGNMFPLGDVGALARSMQAYAAYAVTADAIARTSAEFTWEAVAPRILEIYTSFCGPRKNEPRVA
jgi:glycosyltransferase involved in cell wall biosynthesis